MACAVLALASCRSTPEPPPFEQPPGLRIEQRAFVGGIVGGVLPQAAPETRMGEPADALSLRVTVHFIERLPEAGLLPLGGVTRFVGSLEEEHPIAPATELLRRAEIADGEAAEAVLAAMRAGDLGRHLEVGSWIAALPIGTTSSTIALSASPAIVDESGEVTPGQESMLSLNVEHRGGPGEGVLAIALAVHNRETNSVDEPLSRVEADPGSLAASHLRRELVLLTDEPLTVAGLRRVFSLQSPFEDSAGEGFLVLLEVSEAPDPETEPEAWEEHLVAFDSCRQQATDLAQQAQRSAQVTDRDTVLASAMWEVVSDLGVVSIKRRGLHVMARQLGALLTSDLVTAGGRDFLDAYSAELARQAAGVPPDGRTTEGLAWLLERSAWRLVCDRLLGSEVKPEVESVALRHGGEAVRFPSALRDAASSAADLESFHVMLLEENLDFLRDSNPSSRVRAFEWLQARGRDLQGYDPLADSDARRAALRRIVDSTGAEPTEELP